MLDKLFNNLGLKLISLLPDTYNKDPGSTLGRIICVVADEIKEIKEAQEEVYQNLDIDLAEGVYLERSGANIGQARGSFRDEVYRMAIKSRIRQNFSPGDINSLLDYISVIMQVDIENLSIYQGYTDDFEFLWGEHEPAAIIVEVPYFSVLADMPYGIIEELTAAGVQTYWLFIYVDKVVGVESIDITGFSDEYFYSGQLYSKPLRRPNVTGKVFHLGPEIQSYMLNGYYIFPVCDTFYAGDTPKKSTGKVLRASIDLTNDKKHGFHGYYISGFVYSGPARARYAQIQSYALGPSIETSRPHGYYDLPYCDTFHAGDMPQRSGAKLIDWDINTKASSLQGHHAFVNSGDFYCGQAA